MIRHCLIAAVLAASHQLHAESGAGCDCDKIGATCKASVDFVDGYISLRSSDNRCSLVVWEVDGRAKRSTVIGGLNEARWLGSTAPTLAVTSCRVCEETPPATGADESTTCDPATRAEIDEARNEYKTLKRKAMSKMAQFQSCRAKQRQGCSKIHRKVAKQEAAADRVFRRVEAMSERYPECVE